MTKLNILIVEDELLIAEMLKEMLSELSYNIVAIAKNYNQAISEIKANNSIDLVFLDIHLSCEKTGIDIALFINNFQKKIPFVYLTSYSDPKTIKGATSTIPEAYLVKPFTKSNLFSTMEVIKARLFKLDCFIIIKIGKANIKLSIEEIIYVKSEKNYIDIITKSGRFVARMTIQNFINDLGAPNFRRIHRSYAINTDKVKNIHGQSAAINGQLIPISRVYKKEIESLFYNK